MPLFTPLHSSFNATIIVHAATCGKVAKKRPGYVIGQTVEAPDAKAAGAILLEAEGRDDLSVTICPCAKGAR